MTDIANPTSDGKEGGSANTNESDWHDADTVGGTGASEGSAAARGAAARRPAVREPPTGRH